MPSLLRHPVARFVSLTALVGSLADWVLFATLVVTVDTLIGGGPWATALVLLVRILPSALFAPLAARRVDRLALRGTLVGHEALRVAAVVGLAAGFATGSVAVVLAALLALEFGSAMQAAARESTISRHVPGHLFTRLNTVTAALAYGFLPLGPVIVDQVGAATGWVLAVGGYAALTVAYRFLLPLDGAHGPVPSTTAPVHADDDPVVAAAPRQQPGGWRRVTLAAALGIVPAVTLFALGPTFADAWLGDRTATGGPYALVLGGAAVGGLAANTRGFRADVAMLVAAVGMATAVTGWWVPGLVLVGIGAGAAYLDLQTRLQHAASDPSEFATAFAILKVASAAAVGGAPALASVAPLSAVLAVGAAAAAAGAVVAAPSGARVVRVVVRRLLELAARAVVHVEVVGGDRRVDGPAVVVSNHPHWLDGVVAMLADRSLLPVARWQSHRGARLGIWAADAVVTRSGCAVRAPSHGTRTTPPATTGTSREPRPAFARAADHLRAGGRIWLAPEGGAHTDRQLRPPRSGAVRMAELAGVPVQPLGIAWADDPTGPALGRWRPWRRPAVVVSWGSPVSTTGDVDLDNDRMIGALADATGMSPPAPPIARAAA